MVQNRLEMREFYFKDKKTNVAYRGFQPTTDIDCLPFDYFRYGHHWTLILCPHDIGIIYLN